TRCLYGMIGRICFRDLFANSPKHCFLWKAILFRGSDGLLLWRYKLAWMKTFYSSTHGRPWLWPAVAFLSDSPLDSRRFSRGLFTSAQRKAADLFPMAWIVL